MTVLIAVLGVAVATAQKERPNLVLITADDMNWDSIGVYGSPVPDATPNLDRLAGEGMRFEHAHVNVAVCAPSRSAIMTGLYPHQSGATAFAGIDEDVVPISVRLKESGYYTGIIDKVGHLKPPKQYEWDYVKGSRDTGHGRAPTLYRKLTAAFISEAASEGKPFFLMANSRDPHRPFAGSYQEWQYINAPKNKDEANFKNPPEKIADIEEPSKVYETGETPVPGFLADLPDLRDEVSDYYSSVRRCDDMVGAVLQSLEDAGQAENTLVIFLSDNGIAFPFAKFSCYLHGTRTPVIARWPGVIEPSHVNRDALIEGIDLAPTYLEAAGVKVPRKMEGRSLIPLLKGEKADGFEQAFTAFYMSALREEVPTRAIQEKQYGYIFNLWADGGYQAQNELYKGLALRAMVAASQDDPEIAKRTMFFLFRTREELYDFSADPDGLHNLATHPAHRDQLVRLRQELLGWMRETGDPMTEDYEAYLRGEFGDFSGPESPGEAPGRGRYTPPE